MSPPPTQNTTNTQSFTSYIHASPTPLLGTVLLSPAPLTAKIAARAGFHWAMIDMEHAPMTPSAMTELVHCVAAASLGHCKPVVRVPSHGVEHLKWALDSGAAAVVVPMVETRQQMEDVCARALYPPQGSRSYGPFSAPFAAPVGASAASLAGYVDSARRGEVAVLPMIESRRGVENAEAILQVSGVTGVLIGPYDLRFSLGLPGGDGDEPEFVAALEKVCAIAKRLGKVVGCMATTEEAARKRVEQGMGFLLVSLDYTALQEGYDRHIGVVQRGIDSARKA